MISPRHCNTKTTPASGAGRNEQNGLILIDILLALSLAGFLTIVLTQGVLNANDVFEYAKERGHLIAAYEAHAGQFADLMPYESRRVVIDAPDQHTPTTTITASARWYGNERIQTDVLIRSDSGYSVPLGFTAVRNYPFSDIQDTVGTSLCSVNLADPSPVGSYRFSQYTMSEKDPRVLAPTITPILIPIGSSLPLTDIEIRGDVAYISADSAIASDPDLVVVDIHDSDNPALMSSIHTGPGISAIALVGNRVYAAAASTAAQLHSIRLDSLNSPILEKKYQLPLPFATSTPPMASSIFFDKDQIFLGTDKWDGEEFSIIDVSSSTVPTKIGGFETGSKVNAIFVRNNAGRKVAYVSASDQEQLRAVDVSDAVHPRLLDSFAPSGWERQEGKSLSFFEDDVTMGRTAGGFNITKDHELFSWQASSSSHPVSISGAPASADVPGGMYGIVRDRSYAYTVTRRSGAEFSIFSSDISTTTVKVLSLPVAPQTLTCDLDSLYILASTAPVIYKVTFH